ncbi:MAG: phytanoyl-CoA dioxygenase family protein [Rhodospirillaceae bacterium]|nr:phytanoyl-CoA dioxygenase family protein [Rhodospirillaceae bacterium]
MNVRTLTSNGAPIPFTPQYFAALRESHTGLPAETLRARYAEDGYVLLKGALSSKTVLDLREAYLSLFDSSFFKDGNARRGLFSGHEPKGLPAHGLAGHPAHAFVRSDAFRAFTGASTMKSIAETLFDGPAELIRRTPLRHFIPGRKRSSRAHLDRSYIGGVAADVVTIWVPLGDCPVDAGGLVYMDRSHEDEVLENARANAPNDRTDTRPITHDLKWLSDFSGRRWLYADYSAGDIVVHSPVIVHASLDGELDLMRVSTDIRFQRAGSPSDPRWLDDWSADDGY